MTALEISAKAEASARMERSLREFYARCGEPDSGCAGYPGLNRAIERAGEMREGFRRARVAAWAVVGLMIVAIGGFACGWAFFAEMRDGAGVVVTGERLDFDR